MKKFGLLIILSFLFPQSTVMGLSGLGEEVNVIDPVNAGAGNVSLFSASVMGTSCGTSAQLWKNSNTGLRTMVQFQNLTSNSFANFFTNGINHISVNFSLGKDRAIQFGLIPKIWTQFSVREEINAESPVIYFNDQYYRYKSNYYSRGGLSSLFGAYSQKVSENYSFGFQLESIFGNRFQADSVEVYNYHLNEYGDEVYSSLPTYTITNSIHHYQGHSIRIDHVVNTSIIDLGLSTIVGSPLYVELQDFYTTGIGQAGLDSHTYKIFNFGGRFGTHVKLKNDIGLIVESGISKWKKLKEEHLIFKTQNSDNWSINGGGYKHFIFNEQRRISSVTVRSGFYLTNFIYPENSIIDYGFTIGAGLQFNGQFNSIDIAAIIGQRKVDIYDINNEKYIKLIFGLDIGEKWFLKKK